jgi:hypothetical protein
MKKRIFYLGTMMLLLVSCEGNNDNFIPKETTGTGSNPPPIIDLNTWLIPVSQVKDGGPGKDGIPSLDFPKFVAPSSSEASFLNDNDLVIGIVDGNEVRAYPHLILDWHEIVNDKLNDVSVTINYCPLTGTAFGWKSISNGSTSTFGVSGLLYNSNLILYDRISDSFWSQLKLKCVNGKRIGDEPELLRIVETNWGTWKELYPSSKVLSLDTGFERNYDVYPYGNYKTNHSYFLYTANPSNKALPNKERIYAVIDENVSKVYQFSSFNGGKAVRDTFNGKEYLVVGNENLITAFEISLDYSDLTFEYDFNDSVTFFKDNEGNEWNVFGEAIEGQRKGETLKSTKSVVSFWFAIAAFYPDPEIYIE